MFNFSMIKVEIEEIYELKNENDGNENEGPSDLHTVIKEEFEFIENEGSCGFTEINYEDLYNNHVVEKSNFLNTKKISLF